jgi:hypothetical protein
MAASRADGNMKTISAKAWSWLGHELDAWAEMDKSAHFWWRDDDATRPTGALDRLLGLSYNLDAPLALAVIPAGLNPELVDFLQNRTLTTVLQHGYTHENHAIRGQRKLELGGSRDSARIIADLKLGYQILEQHFDERFTPVLVPPWNRINGKIVSCLREIGFTGISIMKVRRNACPAPGLLQVNTHLDPVNWRHQGGFIGVFPAIAILIQHLQARRSGYRDIGEPTGILTHHLVQNEAVWRFLEDLLHFLSNHPAATWLDAPTIWK